MHFMSEREKRSLDADNHFIYPGSVEAQKHVERAFRENNPHLPLQDSKPCQPESRFMQLHLRIAVILSLRLCNNLESVQ